MSSGTSVIFDDLPIEIRFKVISYLSKSDLLRSVAPVCRSWKELAWNPSLWRELSLVSDCDKGNRCVFDRVPHLQSLTFSYPSQQQSRPSSSLIETLTTHVSKCRSLIELDFSLCHQLTTKHLKRFLDSCPFVRYLNLSGCYHLDDEAFEVVSQLTKLEDLDVSSCSDCYSSKWISKLTANCSNLKAIAFSSFSNRVKAQTRISELIAARSETLEFLLFYYVQNKFDSISRCSRLDTLRIGTAWLMTDVDLLKITNLHRLKHLEVFMAENVSAAALIQLFQSGSLENLVYLDLRCCRNLSNVVVRAFAQKCRRLEYLNLSGCKLVTDVGLTEVVTNCLDLISLTVTGTTLKGTCFDVRPFPLVKLKHLSLSTNDLVTEDYARDLSRVISSVNVFIGHKCAFINGIRVHILNKMFRVVRKCGRSVVT